jgi:hypothetical protein
MSSVFSNDKSISEVYYDLAATEYPGIYLSWDRISSDDFGLNVLPTQGQQVLQRMYSIQRAAKPNDAFIEVGRQQVPQNEFIDEFGKPGYYYKVVLLEVDTSSGTETTIATGPLMAGDALLVKTSLAYEVDKFLNVPVYDEELIFSPDRTRAKLAYSNIGYSPYPEIRITTGSNDGYEEPTTVIDPSTGIAYSELTIGASDEDYLVTTESGSQTINNLYYELTRDGWIHFTGTVAGSTRRYPVSIPSYEIIMASYRVRMFTHVEMNDALFQALQYINAFPGSPKFRTLEATPYYYEQALITIATYFLYRRLRGRLSQRECRLLFGDLGDRDGENYTAGLENIEKMAEDYKSTMEDMRKGAAYAYWPRVGTVTTETYQLPGSRSYMFRSMFNKSGGYS